MSRKIDKIRYAIGALGAGLLLAQVWLIYFGQRAKELRFHTRAWAVLRTFFGRFAHEPPY